MTNHINLHKAWKMKPIVYLVPYYHLRYLKPSYHFVPAIPLPDHYLQRGSISRDMPSFHLYWGELSQEPSLRSLLRPNPSLPIQGRIIIIGMEGLFWLLIIFCWIKLLILFNVCTFISQSFLWDHRCWQDSLGCPCASSSTLEISWGACFHWHH